MTLVLLAGITLADIAFGALAVFFLRRWFSPSREAPPPGPWVRFNLLFFGFCLLAFIEGVLLHLFGFFWFVLIVGITVMGIAKIAPNFWGGNGD